MNVFFFIRKGNCTTLADRSMSSKTIRIFFIVCIAASLTGCSLISQVQRSTTVIKENQYAVQRSSQVISENSEAISKSTQIIRSNQEHLDQANEAIKENLQSVMQSNDAVMTNTRLVKESSVYLEENQKIVEASTAIIGKNVKMLEALTNPAENLNLNIFYIFLAGLCLFFLLPWFVVGILGYRINHTLHQLIILLRDAK